MAEYKKPEQNSSSQDTLKTGKLTFDQMSRDDLIKQVKRQLILLQKTKNRCDELNIRCKELEKERDKAANFVLDLSSACQGDEILLTDKIKLENEISKLSSEKIMIDTAYSSLQELQKKTEAEMFENKSYIENLQEEMNKMLDERNSIAKCSKAAAEEVECLKLKLDTLTETCHCLQNEISHFQQDNEELNQRVNVLTEARDTALQSLSLMKVKDSKNRLSSDELSIEIERLRQHEEKMEYALSESNKTNEVLNKKLEELCSVNKQLENENLILINRCEKAAQESESWKLKLDEYDSEKIRLNSDIQRLEEIEREKKDLQNRLTEIEKEKFSLNEILQSKNNALNEFNCQIEILVASIKQGAKQKNTSGIAEKDLSQNLISLREMYEEIKSQLNNHTMAINNLETQLSDVLEQKQNIIDEMVQIKELKQFLEDEVKELGEENEQLKTGMKSLEANLENDNLHIRKLEIELQETEEREKSAFSELEKLFHDIRDMEESIKSLKGKLIYTEKGNVHLQQTLEKYNNLKVNSNEKMVELVDVMDSSNDLSNSNCKRENYFECASSNTSTHIDTVDVSTQLKINDLAPVSSDAECQVILDIKNYENAYNNNETALLEQLNELRKCLDDVSNQKLLLEDDNKLLISENKKAENSLQNICKTNDDLKQALESKSNLVEKIHCQMDSFLSKIEELNNEIKEKNADLEASNKKINNLQEVIEDFTKWKHNKDNILIAANDIVSILKDSKNSMLAEVDILTRNWKDVHCTTSDAVSKMHEQYNSCFNMLERYKHKNTDLETEILQLKSDIADQENEFLNILKFSEETKFKEMNSIDVVDEVCVKTNAYTVGSTLNEHEQVENNRKVVKEKILFKINAMQKELSKCYEIIHELKANKTDLQKFDFMNNSIVDVEKIPKTIENKFEMQSHDVHALVEKKVNLSKESNSFEKSKEQQKHSSEETSTELLQKKLSETEIKMAKFKAVAIKVKKELAETKKMYQDVVQEKDKFQKQIDEMGNELDNLSSQCFQHVQNFQSLQSEYDKFQDESETSKATMKQLEGDLSSSLAEVNNSKQQIAQLQTDCEKSNFLLDSSIAEKQAHEQKYAELESKMIVLEMKFNAEEKKVHELKCELIKSEKKASEIEEEHKLTKQKLEHAFKEAKKQSLLDLEMADYERSISELNNQVQKKCAEICDLQADIERYSEKIDSLQAEIKHCENQRHIEEERSTSLKEVLEKTKRELTDVKKHEAELVNSEATLRTQLEESVLQVEEYKLQLSKVSAEIQQLQEVFKNSTDCHQRVIRSLESKILCLKQEALTAQKEIENGRHEFENYKIRVHSVLKQQKSVTPSFTSADLETKEHLEKLNNQLKLQVKDLSEKLKVITLENESLQEEHEHLLQRHNKITEELEAKDRSWSMRVEQLSADRNRLQAEQEELSCQHLVQSEMLATTFRQQLKALQEEHKLALEDMQKQLVAADVEISQLQREQQKLSGVSTTPSAQEESFSFDISSQERQEGEGSECTDSENAPLKHISLATIPTSGFLPLEKLLQSSQEPGAPPSVNSDQDTETLSADLATSYKKIDHLSELLNESEANNLRLTEQVRVLKEEVRRLERNKERQEHAENLEYLKNVVIKFATLQSSDEKARLIPVLTTMLKLSPLEQQQLRLIAGETEIADTSPGGWGSYLHRWSGLM